MAAWQVKRNGGCDGQIGWGGLGGRYIELAHPSEPPPGPFSGPPSSMSEN